MNAGINAIEIRHPDKLFIGGKWVEPSSGGQIELVSPITEEVIYKVAEAREADMDRAVAAAREAFDNGPWQWLTPAERANWLRRIAEGLARRSNELAHAWTNQIGVLFSFSEMSAPSLGQTLEMYAAIAENHKFEEPHVPSYGGGRGMILYEPVGVVAGIVPWNAPGHLACTKVGPALAAGCTVVLKASPESPLEAYILAEVADAVGLPEGVLNMVTAHRPASEHLVRNPGVDKVSFTGSSAAGRRIASICGERMARYTMELGGKSAAIVLDDADIEKTAQNLSGAITMMSGQVCAALTRIVVPRAKHDQYAEAFASALSSFRPGDPYDPASHLGPLAAARQLDRVEGYIARGKSEGATLAAGGGRPSGLNRGYYIEPTLFSNVDNRMTIAREEIFGPVLCLIPADGVVDAVRIANESDYGLNGSVFTADPQQAFQIARRMRTGNVNQNGFRTDMSIGFGGYKHSGIGREGGRIGFEAYLEAKTVLLDG